MKSILEMKRLNAERKLKSVFEGRLLHILWIYFSANHQCSQHNISSGTYLQSCHVNINITTDAVHLNTVCLIYCKFDFNSVNINIITFWVSPFGRLRKMDGKFFQRGFWGRAPVVIPTGCTTAAKVHSILQYSTRHTGTWNFTISCYCAKDTTLWQDLLACIDAICNYIYHDFSPNFFFMQMFTTLMTLSEGCAKYLHI